MPETILLVDYENVKDTGLRQLPVHDRALLFVGKGQRPKIGFVESQLEKGMRLDMIQVAEQGKNNLDFYIAFYLGRTLQSDPTARFVVFSNDQDLDPLIAHLKKLGVPCIRMGTLPSTRTPARTPQIPSRAAPAPAPVSSRPAPMAARAAVAPAPAKAAPVSRAAPVRAAPARPAPVSSRPAPVSSRPAPARPAAARPAAPKAPERKPAPRPDYDFEDAVTFLKKAGKRQPKGRTALLNSLADHLQLTMPEVDRIVAALVQSGFLTIAKERVTYL